MACVSSMKKMGMEYVRCDKCHEITWCIGSIAEGCAVCLKCANLSSDNIANIEKKLQELDNSTAQQGKGNRKMENINNNNNPEEIKIGGVEYVRKDSIKTAEAEQTDGMTYCIFRGHECGVHAGYLQNDNMFGSPNAFKVAKARRLWRWNSKFTLTELANSGVNRIDECKFSEPSTLPVILLDVYEVLPCTVAAAQAIMEVTSYDPNN